MANNADLNALYVNCTLKRSPELSHTQGLIDRSAEIMTKNAAGVPVRARTHEPARRVPQLAAGVKSRVPRSPDRGCPRCPVHPSRHSV